MEKRQDNKVQNKSNKAFNIVIYCIAAVLIVVAAVILIQEFVYVPDGNLEEITPGGTARQPLATPHDSYDVIPVGLQFEGYKNRICDVYAVGIENGAMQTINDAIDAAWMSEHPYVAPGQVGNCVIAGHNLYKGKEGTFSILKDMQIGDEVLVECWGTGNRKIVYRYKAIEYYECGHDDRRPMQTATDGQKLLTLITCKGDWNSSIGSSETRIVVVCELVGSV